MREARSPDAPGLKPLAGGSAPGLRSLSRLQFFGWCLLALYFVISFVLIQGREPVWGDELYPQSTAWSIVHGRPANMSVDGLYPQDIPLERFFGPVSFHVAAGMIRLFGLRMLPWRAVCFLFGISLITISTAFLLRLSGGSHWVVLGGASAVLVVTSYCIVAPGRWDPVTVGFIFAGIPFLFHAVNGSAARLVFLAAVAGIFFGLAAGSTPRALPPLTGLACGAIAAACVDAVQRRRILSAGAVAAFSSLVTDALLLAPLGMTPWSWFQTVRSASKGDQIDSSPLLGGQWRPEFLINKAVILLTGFLLISGILCAWAQRGERSAAGRTVKVALATMALTTLALFIVLIARFPTYAIFWLPFLVVASFSWISWDSLQGKTVRSSIAALVCLELLLPAALEIRRMSSGLKLWKGRDPQVLLAEIRSEIPRGSIVFGPNGGFFYPVEQAGSRYLYLGNDITPSLAVGDEAPAYLERTLDAAACTAPTFAISSREHGANAPPDVIGRHVRFEMNSDGVSGPNALRIYRIAVPGDCSSIKFDVSSIRPFGQP